MKAILKIFAIFCLVNSLFAFELDDLQRLKKDELRAEFKLTKRLKGFEKPLKSSGEFIKKQNELFYAVKSPITSLMKINSEGVFFEENNRFVKSEGNYDKGLFLALIDLDFNELKKNFTANLNGDEKKWQVLLKPTNIWLKKIFTHIIIEGKADIEKIELLELNGDLSLYEIKALK